MSNVSFNEILNKKGSSGSIEFNHGDKTLDLVVQKDSSQASQTKDVKALSGGERSFTTLSLLLALGERLETPFRVMDEFDVFLDPVARKIALDTLVRFIGEQRYCDGLTRLLNCFFLSLFLGGSGQVYGASSIHLYHTARSFCFEDGSASQDSSYETA
jgi:hypothetical protein